MDDLREFLIEMVTNIILTHQLPDYGHICSGCHKGLYSEGGGSTLSRHRAEQIVDTMKLEKVFIQAGISPTAL